MLTASDFVRSARRLSATVAAIAVVLPVSTAVGYDDDITGPIPVRKTVWMHWDGTKWSTVPSPNVGAGDNTPLGVIAPAGTTSVWAWGGSADGTLVERFTP